MPKISVDGAKLWEADGVPDWEGVYQQILLPSFNALSPPLKTKRVWPWSRSGSIWAANPDWTRTQVALGLAGIAHLEILNGGVSQLLDNFEDFAGDIPTAFDQFGWQKQAKDLRAAIRLAKTNNENPKLEALDEQLGEFVQEAPFLAGCIAAARADQTGYSFVDARTA